MRALNLLTRRGTQSADLTLSESSVGFPSSVMHPFPDMLCSPTPADFQGSRHKPAPTVAFPSQHVGDCCVRSYFHRFGGDRASSLRSVALAARMTAKWPRRSTRDHGGA